MEMYMINVLTTQVLFALIYRNLINELNATRLSTMIKTQYIPKTYCVKEIFIISATFRNTNLSFVCYFDTLSSHLTIENIATIEIRQTATNTHQVTEIEICSYIIAPKKSEKLPIAVAPSQQPCIKP